MVDCFTTLKFRQTDFHKNEDQLFLIKGKIYAIFSFSPRLKYILSHFPLINLGIFIINIVYIYLEIRMKKKLTGGILDV